MTLPKGFIYKGSLESSKSIINRALILEALHPGLKLEYTSHAQDVLDLKELITSFKNQKSENKSSSHIVHFSVGSGGTTLRFFALFLSKYLGQWSLKLSESLSKRPMEDLSNVLSQLGSKVLNQNLSKLDLESPLIFQFRSNYWTANEVTVDFSKSSQFFSAIALAASDSKSAFKINCLNRDKSSGYEIITLELLKSIGISVQDNQSWVEIQKNKSMDKKTDFSKIIKVGADWSSVIYLLSFCFSGSEVEIDNIDLKSFEPDQKGLKFLSLLGLNYNIEEKGRFAKIKSKPSQLKAGHININLKKNPDLFPITLVLCSQVALKQENIIDIEYPEQLIFKESDRLNIMIQCLKKLGFDIELKDSKLKLKSSSKNHDLIKEQEFVFESMMDHRLIMSYELLKSFGYKIKYKNQKDVQKSFSNFFEIINGN